MIITAWCFVKSLLTLNTRLKPGKRSMVKCMR